MRDGMESFFEGFDSVGAVTWCGTVNMLYFADALVQNRIDLTFEKRSTPG